MTIEIILQPGEYHLKPVIDDLSGPYHIPEIKLEIDEKIKGEWDRVPKIYVKDKKDLLSILQEILQNYEGEKIPIVIYNSYILCIDGDEILPEYCQLLNEKYGEDKLTVWGLLLKVEEQANNI